MTPVGGPFCWKSTIVRRLSVFALCRAYFPAQFATNRIRRPPSLRAISHPRELLLKVKRSATDILKRLAILSRVSKEGAFLPRSIRLRKSQSPRFTGQTFTKSLT